MHKFKEILQQNTREKIIKGKKTKKRQVAKGNRKTNKESRKKSETMGRLGERQKNQKIRTDGRRLSNSQRGRHTDLHRQTN